MTKMNKKLTILLPLAILCFMLQSAVNNTKEEYDLLKMIRDHRVNDMDARFADVFGDAYVWDVLMRQDEDL